MPDVPEPISPPTGFEDLSKSELTAALKAEDTHGLQVFLGKGMSGCNFRLLQFEIPEELTVRTIQIYREIARRQIAFGINPRVQQARLSLLDRALRELGGK